MVRSRSSGKEQILADRLRREAAAGRPEFSETLHRQLCRAVRRCQAAQSVADPVPVSSGRLRYGIVAAMAAAGVLAATVIVWRAIPHGGAPVRGANPSLAKAATPVPPRVASAPQETRESAETLTELEMLGDLADRATQEIGILVESTVTERPWDYLDQKSRLAVEALNNRVPLDAVASLVFADAPTDWPWGSQHR
jgi:hypothetical protein